MNPYIGALKKITVVAIATWWATGAVAAPTPSLPIAPRPPPILPPIYLHSVLFNPAADVYAPGLQVTLTDPVVGSSILFSIDGGFGQPAPPNTLYVGPLLTSAAGSAAAPLIEGSANRITARATAGSLYSLTSSNIYQVALFPSDELIPFPGAFLFGVPQTSSCTYYQAIGLLNSAPASCTDVTPVNLQAPEVINGFNQYTFQKWIDEYTYYDASGDSFTVGDGSNPTELCGTGTSTLIFTPGIPLLANPVGPIRTCATFVNVMDLNFTRDHHAAWNGKFGTDSHSAAYVCNYKGPDFYHDYPTTNANPGTPVLVDQAIRDAQSGKNPGPCVAIDYDGKSDLMRFLAFDPVSGKLLDSVDLDGRGQKTIPAACSSCHGIPARSAPPPAGKPQTVNQGMYIPFDEANLRFSSQTGLRQQDQDSQIKELNRIALRAQHTLTRGSEIFQLVNGWYPAATNPEAEQYYLPTTFSYSTADVGAYDTYAQYCRSCHLANGVALTYTSNGVSVPAFPITTPDNLRHAFFSSGVCKPLATGGALGTMPNAKVTFDRLWTTQVGPAAGTFIPSTISAYVNAGGQSNLQLGTCALPGNYDAFPNQRF